MTPTGSLRYRLMLTGWQNGTVLIRQVELAVKTGWLTRDQADMIYTFPRKPTELVLNDPFTTENLERIKLDVNKQAESNG
jgi:hypothetical protein